MAGDVDEAFRNAMRDVYRRALVEAGYDAKLFARMLSEHGSLETAHRLIATDHPSDGFARLWERRRLDLTVEAQVLRPEFAELFTEADIDTCRRRLEQYGYRA